MTTTTTTKYERKKLMNENCFLKTVCGDVFNRKLKKKFVFFFANFNRWWPQQPLSSKADDKVTHTYKIAIGDLFEDTPNFFCSQEMSTWPVFFKKSIYFFPLFTSQTFIHSLMMMMIFDQTHWRKCPKLLNWIEWIKTGNMVSFDTFILDIIWCVCVWMCGLYGKTMEDHDMN